ncbi:MAG: hypothetical protein RID81_29505 [Sandaracinaceae bacterium]
MKSRRGAMAIAIPFAILALAWGPASRHVRAARLLLGFSDARATEIRSSDATVAGLRARVFRGDGPPLLLVHGAHPEGIDEPRLVRFAELLAEAGFDVTTPEIPALRALRFDDGAVDQIARAARALGPHVGVVGISFGGGLALIAASEEPSIHTVWTVGAHHDATRLAAWWRGEPIAGPGGDRFDAEAERYGAQVLAHAYAEDYFDPAEAAAARAALADVLHRRAPDLEGLSAPTRARVDALRQGTGLDRAALAALTERHRDELSAISPAGHLSQLRARVFVLHGEGDPLVAPTESAWIARELPPPARGAVLRTPLLGHADLADVGLAAQWDVVRFAARALAEL